jgi:hypothetical protein
MAALDDARAAGFDAAAFRDGIRFAMGMGAPNSPAEPVTFRWSGSKTYAVHDPTADPYDWTEATATDTEHADVQPPATIEVGAPAGSESTVVGTFDDTKAVLTILDDDYALVSGADQVVFGGKTYRIDSVVPLGLFDVTVYQLHLAEAAA